MLKKFKLELKWAGIFFIASLLWMVVERMLGLHDEHIDKHATYTNLFAIVAVLIYTFALREKRQTDLRGHMSWKEGFFSGVIISLFIMILTPLSQVITTYIITPHYFEHAIEYGVTHGLTTRRDAVAYFNLKNYMVISMMSAPLMGIATAAVVSLFVRKD